MKLLVSFCVIVAALVGLMYVAWNSTDASSVLETRVDPVVQVAALTPVAVTGSTPVTITIQDVQYQSVRSATAGVVTSIHGGDAVSGATLLSVDDAPVVAFASDAPLTKDVARGDRGPHVKRALQYLNDLGFYDGPITEVAPPAWGPSVRRYNTAVGRISDGEHLTAAGLAWIGPLPRGPFKPSVQVGELVEPQSVLGLGAVVAASASVEEGANSSPAAVGQQLVGDVSGIPVTYEQGSSRIDPALTLRLAGLGRDEYLVQLQLPQIKDSLAVPSGALIGRGEVSCVVTIDDGGMPGEKVRVTVTSEQAGLVLIDPKGAPSRVLANPWEFPGNESCGG